MGIENNLVITSDENINVDGDDDVVTLDCFSAFQTVDICHR